MRVAEVAKRLDVSISLIYLLISEGKLQCTRHGIGRGTLRISEDQLAAYLDEADKPPAGKELKWIK